MVVENDNKVIISFPTYVSTKTDYNREACQFLYKKPEDWSVLINLVATSKLVIKLLSCSGSQNVSLILYKSTL